ncbi:MAG: hypothetical protein WCJ37_03535 [Syntrophus sp. (in: bacteria)]
MDTAISTFQSDATIRWSCLAGDYVFCFSLPDIFANPERDLDVSDFGG